MAKKNINRGVPKVMLMDNSSNYKSKLMSDLLIGINASAGVSPTNPRLKGMVERFFHPMKATVLAEVTHG